MCGGRLKSHSLTHARFNQVTLPASVTLTGPCFCLSAACPGTVTVPADAGQCVASGVSLGTPTLSDTCVGSTSRSATNDAAALLPVGATTVIWTASNDIGVTTTCAQLVNVVDDQPPTISCPAAVNGVTCTPVVLGSPTVADNCAGIAISNNAPTSYPIGVTSVTWTATDANGNTASCVQSVTLVGATDTQNPTVTCPSNATISISTNGGVCFASSPFALGSPTSSDNCGVVSTTNNAPATLPYGTTPVVWTVRDAAGNTAQCTQAVTVAYPTAIGANPTSISISYELLVTLALPASDDFLNGPFTMPFAFSFFGVAKNQYYVSSNGFVSFTNFGNGCCNGGIIPITDGINDLIAACWTDLAPHRGGTYTHAVLGVAPNRRLVVMWNNVPHYNSGVLQSCEVKIFETGDVEVHLVSVSVPASYTTTYGVENLAGNSGSGVRLLGGQTVSNVAVSYQFSGGAAAPPSVSVPSSLNVATCGGTTSLVATASGGIAPLAYSLYGSLFQSGASFTVGAGTYTVTVRDANGCIATSAPSVVSESGAVTATAAAATTTLLCAGDTTSVVVTASGGSAPYEYSLDGSTFQSSPTLTNVGAGVYGAITARSQSTPLCFSVVSPSIIITQPVASASVASTALSCFGDTTSITISVSGGIGPFLYSTGGGFTELSSQTIGAGTYSAISVRDTGAPTCGDIVAPTTIVVTAPASPIGVALSAGTIAACGGSTTLTATTNGGVVAPVAYSFNGGATQASNTRVVGAGTYSVAIRDANGCTATTAPLTVTQPTALTATASLTDGRCGGGAASVVVSASGGGGGPFEYSLDGTTFQDSETFVGVPLGTYTLVTARVKATPTCLSVVRPIVVVAPAVAVSVSSASVVCAGDTVATLAATATGGVTPFEFVWSTGEAGASITASVGGNYAVTASDRIGCTATASFVAADVEAPAIVCPANIGIANDANVCGAVATFAATGADNCPGATTALAGVASGSLFPIGTTTNSFTVTDTSGLMASCSFSVTVSDVQVRLVF